MASIQTLKDINGDVVYPKIVASAIKYNDTTLEEVLNELQTTHLNDVTNLKNQISEMVNSIDTGEAYSVDNEYEEKDITDWYKDGSLYTKIQKGHFTDLNIGNYFTVDNLAVDGYTIDTEHGGNKFYIVGLDCFYGLGDVPLTKHHIVVMPAAMMFTDNNTNYMNSTSTNSTGYANSYMNQTIMPKIATGLKNVFGNHLITYRDKMSTDDQGNTSWYDVTVRLCEREEVMCNSNNNYPDYSVIAGTGGLPMFKLNPAFRQCYSGGQFKYWWLSNYYFGNSVYYSGFDLDAGVSCSVMSNYTACGIRPRFLIG